jgi:hypothetical protein
MQAAAKSGCSRVVPPDPKMRPGSDETVTTPFGCIRLEHHANSSHRCSFEQPLKEARRASL